MKNYGSLVAATTSAGLVIALLPSSMLRSLAGDPWEVDLVRFAAVFVIALGFLWPSSVRSQRDIAQRLPRWILAASLSGGFYLLHGSTLFLVLGFSLLVGGTLDAAFERAFMSSENLMRRIDPSSDPS